jgi:hypothetical protein
MLRLEKRFLQPHFRAKVKLYSTNQTVFGFFSAIVEKGWIAQLSRLPAEDDL